MSSLEVSYNSQKYTLSADDTLLHFKPLSTPDSGSTILPSSRAISSIPFIRLGSSSSAHTTFTVAHLAADEDSSPPKLLTYELTTTDASSLSQLPQLAPLLLPTAPTASSPVHVIINPSAGARTASNYAHKVVIPLLELAGAKSEVWKTTKAGDGERVAREILEKGEGGEERTLLLLGGDGTTHEVLNGLLLKDGELQEGQSRTNLIIVPLGTANALYYHLFPPESPSTPLGTTLSPLYSLLSFLRRSKPNPLPLPVALNSVPRAPSSTSSATSQNSQKRERENTITAVVTSSALHACLLHDAEELRDQYPGVERFKVAAQENVKRWWEGRLKILPSSTGVRRYDWESKGLVPAEAREGGKGVGVELGEGGEVVLEGPFAYVVSSLVSRFEPNFVVAPLRSPHSPLSPLASSSPSSSSSPSTSTATKDEGTIDLVLIRPLRDSQTSSLVDEGEEGAAKAREGFIGRTWAVMGGMYDGGKHLDVKYKGSEGGSEGVEVVEYYRCGGFEWEPLGLSLSSPAPTMAPATNLRIQVQRNNSLTLPQSPLLTSPFTVSPLSTDAPTSATNDDQTPPSTPPCHAGSFNLLAPGPVGLGRRSLLRRNSSMSSVSSSVADEEEDDEEWTREEEERLRTTFDNYVASVDHAPFSQAGPPPSNLTHVVARAVISSSSNGSGRVTRSSKRAQQAAPSASSDSDSTMSDAEASRDSEVQKWRHGLKSTRVKILALVKERQSALEATPTQADPDATPKRGQMARQGSMDFLPAARNVGIVARLGSRLQRAEQSGPPRSGHRPRMSRTGSLTSIAGSPSQPLKAPSTAGPPSSSRMSRIGSDTTGRNPFMSAFDQPPPPHAQSNPTSSVNSPLFNLTFDAPPALGSTNESTFSFPSKTPNPKRSNSTFLSPSPSHSSTFPALGAGLGSAFNSPLLGAYPTPTSQQKKKAKFTHHSPNNSLELKKGAPPKLKLEGAFEEPGVGLGLGGAFSPVIPTASTSTSTSHAGGRLGASASFFLADSEPEHDEPTAPTMSASSSASSLSSLSSTASSDSTSFFPSTRRDRLPTSSSFGSYSSSPPPSSDKLGLGLGLGFGEAGFKCGTPSPMSSTFDLNELSLEGLEESEEEGDSEARMKVDGKKTKREEPEDYWQAGKEAQELRESLSGWGWGRQ
ncbi:hypothetical protein BCR35DRAFT_326432 [Leucosporidium creatinivorum]|uniref:DAGKc domain-containing protein n=1 Tax=Leucosporidium creatinivorum TaxID=106004 RepID=A0A1Y2ECT8_9BASI|nr:hypothetical protein BCR35DRAFT_326432 [Leucosporidium creatinivorum]